MFVCFIRFAKCYLPATLIKVDVYYFLEVADIFFNIKIKLIYLLREAIETKVINFDVGNEQYSLLVIELIHDINQQINQTDLGFYFAF